MNDEEKQLDSTQNPVTEAAEASLEVVPGDVGEGLSDLTVDGSSEGDGGGQADATPVPEIDYASQVTDLENQISHLKAQLEDRTSQCVRMAADFDNYRKRTQREREEMEQQIKCSTINELLPVVDNFERARSQIKPQTDQETTIHKSYQSVYKQLVDCLKRVGVSPMRSEGKEFDPNLHEAVMRQASHEFPEGTVMEELQRGYLLGERVLRHALVKVAAAPEPEVDSEASTQGTSDS
jgi:molecular chaperone GrpE